MAITNRLPLLPTTEIEQDAFCRTENELTSLPLELESQISVQWQKIPEDYYPLDSSELEERISAAKRRLGSSLLILGHHYQRDEVIKFADFRGDSFKLAQQAVAQKSAEYVVFCGVHFMAETADILTDQNQRVILPNLAAGCSMADMAPTEDVTDCWDDLTEILGNGIPEILPVTYMNSTAAIKALCGKNGGIVCTSSNAQRALEWSFSQAQRVVFFPDEHLGRNTGLKMGIPLEKMIVWNPFKPLGGHTPEAIQNAKLILWQGRCSVHTRFTASQIEKARIAISGLNVVVHPECPMETVAAADYVGSTEVINKVVSEAPAGSSWAIGTEISLVNRIAAENPDKTVFCLDPVVCPCTTMYRIHPAYLAWVLEGIEAGSINNQIIVDGQTRQDARIALDSMLTLV
tara:strand:+ start:9063 stop:10274 length:1212 start_codon:yes stop_codon:yes gene_type:complete